MDIDNEQGIRAWVRAHGGRVSDLDWTTGSPRIDKSQAWAAGQRYQGRLGMLGREARSRYGATLAGQTYYDGAIAARDREAHDSGDLIAEAEVRAYAFAFVVGPNKRPEI